jgi:hypothetical protein
LSLEFKSSAEIEYPEREGDRTVVKHTETARKDRTPNPGDRPADESSRKLIQGDALDAEIVRDLELDDGADDVRGGQSVGGTIVGPTRGA